MIFAHYITAPDVIATILAIVIMEPDSAGFPTLMISMPIINPHSTHMCIIVRSYTG